MINVLNPASYSYPLNIDLESVLLAKENYASAPGNKLAMYQLKKAVYNTSLTLKAKQVSGELSSEVCDTVNDYIWGLLL